ncbi:MAG: purine-nucleoside phosphorylase [Bacilli bacterium]|nr:purine-nucleoside phosphorylase [Bacilli bacterium]
MTPHIEAKENEIADIVIMPGDPLRAEYIAQNYLENYKLVNKVRNVFAYTGFYKNRMVTIMASGMGMPSMGIYAYELFKFYNVDSIIRVGSCGAYSETINLGEIVLVDEAYTDSSFARVYDNSDISIEKPSLELNERILATICNKNCKVGKIYSTDVFYRNVDINKLYKVEGCLGEEMESFALFHIAKSLNKKAACLLTVSDNLKTHQSLSSVERQNSFKQMIEIALDSIV